MLKATVIEYRAEHCITQEQFAKLIGVSIPTIIKIEKGDKPSNLVIAKVAHLVGKSFTELSKEEAHAEN